MPFLDVLCPDGHKVIVEISKSTPLIQALEKACKISGLDPLKYRFSHNRRPVDLSQSFDHSGLVNHADVELILSDRVDQGQYTPRICLRLDNGQRVEWTGRSDTPIWSILEQLASTNSHIAEIISGQHSSSSGNTCPAIIYLQEKVVGENNLRSTTLANLGIIHGSALLQLNIVPYTGEDNPQSQRSVPPCEPTTTTTSTDIISKSNKIDESMEQISRSKGAVMNQEIVLHKEVHKIDDDEEKVVEGSHGVNTISPNFGDIKPQLATSSNHRVESNTYYNSSDKKQEITAMDEDTFSGFVSPFSVFSDRPSVSAFANVGQMESTHCPSVEQERRPRTLGEILGINLETTSSSQFRYNEPQSSIHPFHQFKFPTETEGENLNSKISDSEAKSSSDNTIDREVIVFRRPTKAVTKNDAIDDLPDEVFELTEEDIRKLLRSYHNEWIKSEPLQTAAMRAEARRKYYSKYPRAIIQFHWVDNVVIQACFTPSEKVSELYEFVRGLLKDSCCNFQLYTTPPKQFLSDKNNTLIEANLVPLSKVFYDPIEFESMIYIHVLKVVILQPNVLEKATEENFVKAQSIVSNWMKNLQSSNSRQSNSSTEHESSQRRQQSQPTTSESEKGSLPKWLKLGK
ncbi:unnamed protein product [Trichobilharzia szidati]|nr:unnamed protein product [Trichobilharzia szidati]